MKVNKISPDKISGHYSTLYLKEANNPMPTTLTTQRKSRAREKEAAKKALLLAEIAVIVGADVNPVSRSVDQISRRWTGTKHFGHDE